MKKVKENKNHIFNFYFLNTDFSLTICNILTEFSAVFYNILLEGIVSQNF